MPCGPDEEKASEAAGLRPARLHDGELLTNSGSAPSRAPDGQESTGLGVRGQASSNAATDVQDAGASLHPLWNLILWRRPQKFSEPSQQNGAQKSLQTL
jgi:hypothetical protein